MGTYRTLGDAEAAGLRCLPRQARFAVPDDAKNKLGQLGAFTDMVTTSYRDQLDPITRRQHLSAGRYRLTPAKRVAAMTAHRVIGALAAMTLCLGAAAPANAATRPMGLPRLMAAPVLRPKTLSGTRGGGNWSVRNIRWASWGPTVAVGLGQDMLWEQVCRTGGLASQCEDWGYKQIFVPAVVILDGQATKWAYNTISIGVFSPPGLNTSNNGELTSGWYNWTFPGTWPTSLGGNA